MSSPLLPSCVTVDEPASTPEIPTASRVPRRQSTVTALLPEIPKPKRTKKAKKVPKNSTKQSSTQDQDEAATKTSKSNTISSVAEKLLFQQLANDMTNGLINAGQIKPTKGSLDLLNRLSLARVSSTTRSTVTTTTTTQFDILVEKDITACPLEISSKSTTSTSSLASSDNSALEDSNNQCVLSDILRQAAKLGHLLPFYQIGAHGSRQASLKAASQRSPNTFTLGDFAAIDALKSLAERYGRVSHMGILDPSYTFFITKARDAALYYKVKNNVAVIVGDPLCEKELYRQVLKEFAKYRKQRKLGVAFLGASEEFTKYAKKQRWVTMQFGIERVLNPLTNPILLGKCGKTGKRMTNSNKTLLDPKKGGLTVEVYSPSVGRRPELQEQLVGIYDAWRDHRNQSGVPQAYITVFDPFALPDLMTYIYTKDREGRPNGFAALRKLCTNDGFHIDPCIAAPGAPKGITDLLVFSAMALLNKAGISYLSFGFEPLDNLGEINGMPKSIAKLTRVVHREVFQGLKVGGKKEYHAKFKPDEAQESGLYLVFPDGIPGVRHMTAIVHHANISIRQLVVTKLKKVSITKEVSFTEDVSISTASVGEHRESESSSRSHSSEMDRVGV
jgi:Phosphatidylglycerol lysyltransferase, C-terminal